MVSKTTLTRYRQCAHPTDSYQPPQALLQPRRRAPGPPRVARALRQRCVGQEDPGGCWRERPHRRREACRDLLRECCWTVSRQPPAHNVTSGDAPRPQWPQWPVVGLSQQSGHRAGARTVTTIHLGDQLLTTRSMASTACPTSRRPTPSSLHRLMRTRASSSSSPTNARTRPSLTSSAPSPRAQSPSLLLVLVSSFGLLSNLDVS